MLNNSISTQLNSLKLIEFTCSVLLFKQNSMQTFTHSLGFYLIHAWQYKNISSWIFSWFWASAVRDQSCEVHNTWCSQVGVHIHTHSYTLTWTLTVEIVYHPKDCPSFYGLTGCLQYLTDHVTCLFSHDQVSCLLTFS